MEQIIPDEQIKLTTRAFVKKCRRCKFQLPEASKIALCHNNDEWTIEICSAYSRRPTRALIKFSLPTLPPDPDDAALELASFLHARLKHYNRAKKASAARSPELRRAIATLGVQARQIRRKKA